MRCALFAERPHPAPRDLGGAAMREGRQFPAGTRVDDLDFSGVHLHGADFEGAKLTDAHLRGAVITGDIEGLQINEVDVDLLVQAELDRRFPARVKLRSTNVEGLRDAWSMLEGLWIHTTERARGFAAELQVHRVDGEWSFVETLRHLIFATDCWLARAIQLTRHPYHPWGLPWTGVDREWAQEIGLDVTASPGLEQILPVRVEHQQAVRDELEKLTGDELLDVRMAPDDPGYPQGPHPVLTCLHVLLNEEWQHHRYAVRDLDVLQS
jgi:hypothetical protein